MVMLEEAESRGGKKPLIALQGFGSIQFVYIDVANNACEDFFSSSFFLAWIYRVCSRGKLINVEDLIKSSCEIPFFNM